MHKNKLFVFSLFCFSAASLLATEAVDAKPNAESKRIVEPTPVRPVEPTPVKPVEASAKTETASATEAKPTPAAEEASAPKATPAAAAWYRSFQRPAMPTMPTMPTMAAVGASSAAVFSNMTQRISGATLPSEASVDGYYANGKKSVRQAYTSVSDVYGKVNTRVSAQTWLREGLRKPVAITICLAPVYVAYRGVKAIHSDIKSVFGFTPKAK